MKPLTDKVDELFAEWDKPDSPGCALGIIKNGKLIYKRGYGMANLEHNIPISSTTVFRIASTSKQFTATSILLLAEQGKISLDDDIRKYLSETPQYERPITIRHLIHHTSGIRDYLELMELAGMSDHDYFTDEEAVEMLTRQKELNFKPGDEYLYSNSGYYLLSMIIKRASGKFLREFAEERIFKPLGMKNTHFHEDHTMIVKNRAAGYSPKEEGGYRINMTTLPMVGDGGVFTSVEDLFLWDQNFYHNKLGGRDLINQLLTLGTLNDGEKLNYAFGLEVGDYRGLKTISHSGIFAGFRAQIIRFPQQKFSVICLANLSTINPTKLCKQVAAVYLAEQFKEEKAKFIELPEQELKGKTGIFRDPKIGTICELSVKDGKLMVNLFGMSFQIVPLSKTQFRSVDDPVDADIRFEMQDQNKPLLVHVTMEGEKPVTFEAIQVVCPTAAQLAEYFGDYYSGELKFTYKLVLEDGKLFFRYRSAPKKPLFSTLSDMFKVGGTAIHFIRDSQNRISAFTLSTEGARNICFFRKQVEKAQ
jgi:CubicO group peptidase (beta-lactamase class C family)